MDKGYPTAFEGDIFIDLLYVAADNAFDEYRSYIKKFSLGGTSVVALDVEGMLLSKKTTREDDIPDRLKLERLKNAQIDLEKKKRVGRLPELASGSNAAKTFWNHADIGVRQAETGLMNVNWADVEKGSIVDWVAIQKQPHQEISNVIFLSSPGCISRMKREAVVEFIEKTIQQEVSVDLTQQPPPDRSLIPK
jgi:hypothetical protein